MGTTVFLTPRKAEKGGGVKARIVAQDFATEKREDTFSPTPDVMAVRLVLTIACVFDLVVGLGDYSAAFLNAPLDDEQKIAVRNQSARRTRATASYGFCVKPVAYTHLTLPTKRIV